jgi:aliphatic nitrilase
VIVAPNSRILAGPMGAEEGILYAECNLELGILTKLRHDFAGHYNRPDIFQLHVNRTAPHIYAVHGPDGVLPGAAPEAPTLDAGRAGGLLGRPDSDSTKETP